MSKTFYNLAYGQRPEGKEKTFWKPVGILVHDHENDRISVHLDVVPAGNWNGWLSAFPKDDKPASAKDDFDPDSIPF